MKHWLTAVLLALAALPALGRKGRSRKTAEL